MAANTTTGQPLLVLSTRMRIVIDDDETTRVARAAHDPERKRVLQVVPVSRV